MVLKFLFKNQFFFKNNSKVPQNPFHKIYYEKNFQERFKYFTKNISKKFEIFQKFFETKFRKRLKFFKKCFFRKNVQKLFKKYYFQQNCKKVSIFFKNILQKFQRFSFQPKYISKKFQQIFRKFSKEDFFKTIFNKFSIFFQKKYLFQNISLKVSNFCSKSRFLAEKFQKIKESSKLFSKRIYFENNFQKKRFKF